MSSYASHLRIAIVSFFLVAWTFAAYGQTPKASLRIYNSTLATMAVEVYRDRNEYVEFVLPPRATKRVAVPAGRVRFIAHTYHRPPKVMEKETWYENGKNYDFTLKDSMFGSGVLAEASELPAEARGKSGLQTSSGARPDPANKGSWLNGTCHGPYMQYVNGERRYKGAVFVMGYNADKQRFVCSDLNYGRAIDNAEKDAHRGCNAQMPKDQQNCETKVKQTK